MGKQVRRTYKPRPTPLGNKPEAGVIEGLDQNIVLQPDQVLPVVQKVKTPLFFLCNWLVLTLT